VSYSLSFLTYLIMFENRFVDRDMFMRYLGGGVGHVGTPHQAPRPYPVPNHNENYLNSAIGSECSYSNGRSGRPKGTKVNPFDDEDHLSSYSDASEEDSSTDEDTNTSNNDCDDNDDNDNDDNDDNDNDDDDDYDP
jgi:hypothetical protein